MKLTLLPNIGKILAERLNKAGIETSDQLFKLGSKAAFMKLVAVDDEVCITLLYGLEGAIQGIRWHDIKKKRREELKEFYFEWRDPK